MPSKAEVLATEPGQWSVYILRCADNSLYTGVTTDVQRRLDEHNGLVKNGAKYTRNRQPVKLVYQEAAASRSEACKRESAIKNLNKSKKEQLVEKKSENFL
jgi:putative endonuclease